MQKTSLTIGGQRPENEPDPEAIAREKNERIQKLVNDKHSPMSLEQKVKTVIQTVHDPEIPVNIYELGLIYKINIKDAGRVQIDMTLTSPACPVAQELPAEVQQKVLAINEVTFCQVDIVWDPPWSPSLMSEDARLALGL